MVYEPRKGGRPTVEHPRTKRVSLSLSDQEHETLVAAAVGRRVLVERENARFKTQWVASQRAQKEREAQEAAEKAAQRAKWRAASFPSPPTTRSLSKGITRAPRTFAQRQTGNDEGYEPVLIRTDQLPYRS